MIGNHLPDVGKEDELELEMIQKLESNGKHNSGYHYDEKHTSM